MSGEREKECPECGDTMRPSTHCGVMVCENDECGYHDGLARCYCGWSLSGNNGRRELEEMGETIEEDY